MILTSSANSCISPGPITSHKTDHIMMDPTQRILSTWYSIKLSVYYIYLICSSLSIVQTLKKSFFAQDIYTLHLRAVTVWVIQMKKKNFQTKWNSKWNTFKLSSSRYHHDSFATFSNSVSPIYLSECAEKATVSLEQNRGGNRVTTSTSFIRVM